MRSIYMSWNTLRLLLFGALSAVLLPGQTEEYLFLSRVHATLTGENEAAFHEVLRWNITNSEVDKVFYSENEVGKVIPSASQHLAIVEESEDDCTSTITIVNCQFKIEYQISLDMFVHDLCFMPNGDSFAYIAGHLEEPIFRGDPGEGLFCYDPATGTSAMLSERAFSVHWAEFNNCVYYDSGSGVYCKNLQTGELVLTEYLGTSFSGDGRYYFDPGPIEGPLAIYQRIPHRKLSIKNGFELDSRFLFRLVPIRWLDNCRLLATERISSGAYKTYVLDVCDRAVLKPSHRIVAGIDDKNALEARVSGEFVVEEYARMDKIEAEGLPSLPEMGVE